jgi:Tfp pilus assembly protein PilV
MPKLSYSRKGLTLAEIIMAVGFLSVFTTGLLAIATKTFEFSRQQIDMASAYQHGEGVMESYALKSRDPLGWATMVPTASPTFPTYQDASGATRVDPRFVYTVQMDNLDTDLRFVTVTVFKSNDASAALATPSPVIDTAAPRGGELLRFVNIYQQEVNDA